MEVLHTPTRTNRWNNDGLLHRLHPPVECGLRIAIALYGHNAPVRVYLHS
jgi:hypothetical protein